MPVLLRGLPSASASASTIASAPPPPMPAPTATPTVTAVQKIIPLPLPLPRPHRKGLHCQGLLPAPATHGGSGGPAPQLLDAALDENVWECNEEFLLLGSGSESDTATTATTATAVGSNSSCCLSMPFVRGHGTQLGWRILELHKAYLEAQAQRARWSCSIAARRSCTAR